MPLLTDLTQNKLKPPTRDLIDTEKTAKEMKAIIKCDLENRHLGKKDILSLASAWDPRFKLLPFLTEDEQLCL